MLGVPVGPRDCTWNPAEPATLVWAEALDGGDLRTPVPQRDRLCVLQAPFTGPPSEWLKFQHRVQSIAWTSANIAMVTEFDRATRVRRTWTVEGGVARRAFEVSAEDRYKDPGRPVLKPRFGGGPGVIMQVGDWIYLEGDGASPKGDRPFLDRFNVKTFETERLFQCEGESYESVAAVLADNGRTLLTRYETVRRPPNYLVRDLTTRSERALTDFKDPAPQLAGVERQFITYARKDGVALSGTLYLPPGYKKGERLPLVMWAYPREFTDPAMAGQVSGSPYRFTDLHRRVAPLLPHAGLRGARQPVDADRRAGRNGQRHLRRAARGERRRRPSTRWWRWASPTAIGSASAGTATAPS